ncbi:MAG: FAD-binding oxidoreductase [Crocinitomicaceae bacterium]|nr:FAD-binding oxidoreductase [Crocinitomicaceae bacterium]MBK8927112.1 FAD-binding oxidoreductase [Crocinitomicaceae bacterium]
MVNSKKHYQIIGWGLAGACLAMALFKRKVSFSVIDSDNNFGTRVAAGLINPIVFKRLTKTWNVDSTLPAAIQFYHEIEYLSGNSLLSKKNIIHPFSSIEEQNNWGMKMQEKAFENYIDFTEKNIIKGIALPYSAGLVKTPGNLNTANFLSSVKSILSAENIQFEQTLFNYDEVEKSPEIEFIFCEGSLVTTNPYFKKIPMKPAHGDILTLEIPDLITEDIISKNIFILPIGRQQFKVGSTYNWELQAPTPTTEGKKELLNQLENLISSSYRLINHEAGIRPTIADRRPVIGQHPRQKNCFLFNGLGTKGVLLAPYYANQLAEFLVHGHQPDDDVNVSRFSKRLI